MEGFLFSLRFYPRRGGDAVPDRVTLGPGSCWYYLAAGIPGIGPALGWWGLEPRTSAFSPNLGVGDDVCSFIGLELEPRALWNMRHRLLGLVACRVVLSAAPDGHAPWPYDQPLGVAIAIGLTLFVCHLTAIVLQTLSERG